MRLLAAGLAVVVSASGVVQVLAPGVALAAATTTATSTTYPQTYGDWANGLLAGNGKQGIIVFGNPRNETVVFDDKRFFMARSEARPHRTFNTVSPDNIQRIRDLLSANRYQEANQLAADVQGYQGGGEGSKHPGFKMTIQMPDSRRGQQLRPLHRLLLRRGLGGLERQQGRLATRLLRVPDRRRHRAVPAGAGRAEARASRSGSPSTRA